MRFAVARGWVASVRSSTLPVCTRACSVTSVMGSVTRKGTRHDVPIRRRCIASGNSADLAGQVPPAGAGPSTGRGSVVQPEGGGLVLEVAVLGLPNVGKSTLTNALIGRKVSIESPRVQTTRESVLGVATSGRTQITYYDTPGLITHVEGRRHGLARPLLTDARNSTSTADVVLGIVDGRTENVLPPLLSNVLEATNNEGTRVPCICVINKADVISPEKLERMRADLATLTTTDARYEFDAIFQVSALEGTGVGELREYLQRRAGPGVWQYTSEQVTDHSLLKFTEERIREQLLRHLRLELPYSAFQRNLQVIESDTGIEIKQAVVVKSETHKRIVIGKRGVVIRSIANAAQNELSEFYGKPVQLVLTVITATERQRLQRQM